jgi:hydrogenase maturation protease
MRTIVVGLGNPILSDDSVGIKAASLVKALLAGLAQVEVAEAYAGGLRLMEAIAGYDRAIIVDAMTTGTCAPGTVVRLRPGDAARTRNLLCTHDSDLETSLCLGRELGLALPGEIRIIGIEAKDVENFGEELTSTVQAALPAAVAQIVSLCRSENWS